MSDMIEVTVRVPADLEVLNDGEMYLTSGGVSAWYGPNGIGWKVNVWQQIAAAVEARKPKPPKFQVGDVVEWDGGSCAGVISSGRERPGGYNINGEEYWMYEADLKLVRRAEK